LEDIYFTLPYPPHRTIHSTREMANGGATFGQADSKLVMLILSSTQIKWKIMTPEVLTYRSVNTMDMKLRKYKVSPC